MEGTEEEKKKPVETSGSGLGENGNGTTRTTTVKTVMKKKSRGSNHGFSQVLALVEKNLLSKARTPWSTFAELFSPVLILLLLSLAYNLSDENNVPSRQYHSIEMDVPPFFLVPPSVRNELELQIDIEEELADIDTHRSRSRSRSRRSLLPLVWEDEDEDEDEDALNADDKLDLDHYHYDDDDDYPDVDDDVHLELDLVISRLLEEQWFAGEGDEESGLLLEEEDWKNDAKSFLNQTNRFGKRARKKFIALIEKMMGSKTEDIDIGSALSFFTQGNIYGNLHRARQEFNRVLKRPLIVPTYGQFVTVSKTISSMFNANRIPQLLQDSEYARRWGNLFTLGTIHLSPRDSHITMDFWSYLNTTYPSFKDYVKVRVHDTEQDAIQFVQQHLEERTWAVLDFSDLTTKQDAIIHEDGAAAASTTFGDGQFKIRMNYTTVPNTYLIENYVAVGLSRKYQRYYLSGYLTLQRTVDEFLLKQHDCDPDALAAPLFSMPMPTAAFNQNIFFLNVGYLMGMTICMAFLYPTSRLIKSLVEEKETRMKETLLILGVRSWAHTLSWLLSALLTFGVITCSVTYLLSSTVLKFSSTIYLFFFFFFFSTASIALSFCVASFFSRAKLAAIVGPMTLFATLLPRFIFFGTNRYEAAGMKFWASLLPGTTLAFGADIIGDYEYAEQGVQYYNVWDGQYSFGTSVFFLFFDTFFYLFLAWYFDQVLPRQYGIAKPWHFVISWPIRGFYRCVSSSRRSQDTATVSSQRRGDHDSNYESIDTKSTTSQDEGEYFERVMDPNLVPRVCIQDLVKRYPKTKKDDPAAVNGLNLTLYESQITALLGHNGAGKTSTVSVLTGLYPPTSGDVTIYGNSIANDLSVARQSIGICPQHDVLFENLTVLEHLRFFCRIKGIRPTKAALQEKAEEMGLEDHMRTTAGALSGGNKRKLSVAISLCGDPKFLILDEPTSSMDPASRRHCWDVLRKQRVGRVTLLTTHFMDEADLLSDRVAVLSQGRLQCCGSQVFLKDRFKLGWNFTLVMEKPSEENDLEQQKCQQLVARRRITSFLKGLIPDADLVRKAGRELTFSFPKGSEELFAGAFDALEAQSRELGITSYGIENASLEELFLLLAEEKDGENNKDDHSIAGTGSATDSLSAGISFDNQSSISSNQDDDNNDNDNDDDDNDKDNDGQQIVNTGQQRKKSTSILLNKYDRLSPLQQIGLLYWKRWTAQKRDWKGAFFTIILPVLCVCGVMMVLTVTLPLAGPPIEISPRLYEKSPSSVYSVRETEVVMGRGILDNNNNNDAYLTTDSDKIDMLSTMATAYPSAVVREFPDVAVSSKTMSNFLLDTYNDHDHNVRFGAFVLEDRVPFKVLVNWKILSKTMAMMKDKLLTSLGIDRLDLFELLGRPHKLSWTIAASDVADEFFDRTSLDRNAGINTADYKSLTDAALRAIFEESRNSTKAESFRQSVDAFVDDIYERVERLFTLYMDERNSLVDHVSDLFDVIRLGNASTDLENEVNELLVRVFKNSNNYSSTLSQTTVSLIVTDINTFLSELASSNNAFHQETDANALLAGNISQIVSEFVANDVVQRGNTTKLTENLKKLLAVAFEDDGTMEAQERDVLISNIVVLVSQFFDEFSVKNETKLEGTIDAYLTTAFNQSTLLDHDDDSLKASITDFISDFVSFTFGQPNIGQEDLNNLKMSLNGLFDQSLKDSSRLANDSSALSSSIYHLVLDFVKDNMHRERNATSQLEGDLYAVLSKVNNVTQLNNNNNNNITQFIHVEEVNALIGNISHSVSEIIGNAARWGNMSKLENDMNTVLREFFNTTTTFDEIKGRYHIREIVSELVNDAQWGNTTKLISKLENDIDAMLKEVFQSLAANTTTILKTETFKEDLIALFTELLNYRTLEDIIETNSLAGNMSQILSEFVDEVEYANTTKVLRYAVSFLTESLFERDGANSYKWRGDTVVRNFLNTVNGNGNGMYDVTSKVRSMYDLVVDLADNVTDSLNDELKSRNITVNSVKDMVYETLDGYVSSLFNETAFRDLVSKMKDTVENERDTMRNKRDAVMDKRDSILDRWEKDDIFDRMVIEREMASLIAGVSDLLGIEIANPTAMVETILKKLDGIATRISGSNDRSNDTRIVPGYAFVAPLAFTDTLLGKLDFSFKVKQVFGILSEFLGGRRSTLDGFFSIEVSTVVMDLDSMSVDGGDIFIATADRTLVNFGGIHFNFDFLASMMPTTNVTNYHFDLYSKASLLHNASSPHAVAAFNQAYMENAYKQCKRDATARLVSVNHPLPLTVKQSLEIKVMLSVMAGLFILIPYCYIPAAFIVFLVKERMSKSKHLQLVSGVNMSSYWIATYLWDITLFFILTVCIMIAFMAYGDAAAVFVGDAESFICTMALTFGYGLSVLPYSYLLSRKFQNHSSAQIAVAGFVWLTGFVTVTAYVTLNSLPRTRDLAASLQPFFRIFPAHNLGEGFIMLSTAFWEREIIGIEKYPLDWDVTGRSIVLVYSLSIPYFVLLLNLEYSGDGGSGGVIGKLIRWISASFNYWLLRWYGVRADDEAGKLLLDDDANETDATDEDVLQERFAVLKNKEAWRQSTSVLLVNLWKVYPPSVGLLGSLVRSVRNLFALLCRCCCPPKQSVGGDDDNDDDEDDTFQPRRAVRGVTTAIKEGETYALLGANGAGKTTTLGILTGDISVTGGEAYVSGFDVSGRKTNSVSAARENIGVCPQIDPLIELMTGRETLTMFARLRGIPKTLIPSVVEELLERLTLTPHADKVSKAYSGGNKRKLSLGMALIGDPKVLLIDESSSGLDPLAKRRMWDLIEQAARSRCVVITTHSMQEAEALSTRVAIMVKGQFVCLGSIQQLKTKFMDGYSVEIFCNNGTPDEEVVRVMKEVLNNVLPGSQLSERHGRFLRFEVMEMSNLGLGACFRRLQELKDNSNFPVENYSIAQCSLEQVFIKLVKNGVSSERASF